MKLSYGNRKDARKERASAKVSEKRERLNDPSGDEESDDMDQEYETKEKAHAS